MKLEAAIANNAALYAAVFGARGQFWQSSQAIDFCLERAPALYSNLITRKRAWVPDEVFRTIDTNARNEAWSDWSVKDSYAELQLGHYGFKRLFDANWLYLDGSSRPIPSTEIRFVRATTEDAFVSWCGAWDQDATLGAKIFGKALLADPYFHFFYGFYGEAIACGFIANRTGDVMGLSNYFGPIQYWADAVSYCQATFSGSGLVGYERNPTTVEYLREIGFEIVGDLAVWVKQV